MGGAGIAGVEAQSRCSICEFETLRVMDTGQLRQQVTYIYHHLKSVGKKKQFFHLKSLRFHRKLYMPPRSVTRQPDPPSPPPFATADHFACVLVMYVKGGDKIQKHPIIRREPFIAPNFFFKKKKLQQPNFSKHIIVSNPRCRIYIRG